MIPGLKISYFSFFRSGCCFYFYFYGPEEEIWGEFSFRLENQKRQHMEELLQYDEKDGYEDVASDDKGEDTEKG